MSYIKVPYIKIWKRFIAPIIKNKRYEMRDLFFSNMIAKFGFIMVFALFAILVWAHLSAPAWASDPIYLSKSPPQIVQLRNGDRLTARAIFGKMNDSAHTISLRMQAGPVITLNKIDISRIIPLHQIEGQRIEGQQAQTQPSVPAQLTPPITPPLAGAVRPAFAPVELTQADFVQAKTAAVAPAVTPGVTTAVQAKPKTESSDPIKWSGRVELGGELQTGNSDTTALSIDTRLTARDKQNRYQADFDFNKSKDEGEVTDDNKRLRFEYSRFQTEKWFLGVDVDLENDDIAELDLRSRIALKSGYQFYDNDDLSLRADLGLAYLNENFANESTDTSIAIAQDLDYEQGFFDDAMRLFYEHSILLPSDDFAGFIFDSEAGIRVPVAKKFIGTAGVEFDWDNDPAQGVREEDLTYTLKLGYEF